MRNFAGYLQLYYVDFFVCGFTYCISIINATIYHKQSLYQPKNKSLVRILCYLIHDSLYVHRHRRVHKDITR